MLKGFFNVPKAVNEPVKSYAPNSPEKKAVLAAYKEMWNTQIDVPLYIGSEEIRTGNIINTSWEPITWQKNLMLKKQSLTH